MERENLESKIAELEKQLILSRCKLNEIKKKDFIENKLPLIKRLAGKCFIYKDNCYSVPKDESDYWNTYYKVIDVDSFGGCKCVVIQKDSYGEISYSTEKQDYKSFTDDNSVIEILKSDFEVAIRMYLKEIEDGCFNEV